MRPPEPAPDTVLGLDNVPLALPVANVGARALAGFIDYVAIGVLVTGWSLAVLALAISLGDGAVYAFVLLVLGWFVLEYGYFAGFEIFMAGQTPGKRALGLRVVDGAGGRADTRAFLVRNCVRTVDLLLGVVLMFADPLARRLGDRLAGTLVVHEAEETEPTLAVHRVPRGWVARDVAVVEGYFRRHHQLDPERSAELARGLLAAVRRDDPALLDGLDEHDPVETLRHALDVRGA